MTSVKSNTVFFSKTISRIYFHHTIDTKTAILFIIDPSSEAFDYPGVNFLIEFPFEKREQERSSGS